MSSLEEKYEQALKEINYYKNRLKELTTSCMSLEYRNADLSKDVLQMSEGLKVIAELQNVEGQTDREQLFDSLAESINIRLKMDVAAILLPVKPGSLDYVPRYLKGFGSYNTDAVRNKLISVPRDFFDSKKAVMLNQEEPQNPFEQHLRDQLEIHHLVFSPILHNKLILGYFFAGRRPQILQKGKGVLPYHLNILDAIGGVISTVQSQLERQAVLESLVEARTKELKEEKEISENLLLNILPYETTQELKARGTVKAKDYNLVTVIFTDFKDFTLFSAGLSSQDLVEQIDFYYQEIDRITSRLGIEKIKTIGDSYMCAAGLPVEREDHAIIAVQAAIEIRDFVKKTKQERERSGKPFFEIRIGMNSGPVVAGIVGIKKFAYDIWGDTVNVAAIQDGIHRRGGQDQRKSIHL
jgi:class 3 adenylate cyclase